MPNIMRVLILIPVLWDVLNVIPRSVLSIIFNTRDAGVGDKV